MDKKLFVGNLSYSVTEDQLRELFSKVGKVVSCSLVKDKFSNQSRGFAFVEMSSDKEAQDAIGEYHDSEIDGRKIVVNIAKPKEASDRPRNNFRNQGNFRGPRR